MFSIVKARLEKPKWDHSNFNIENSKLDHYLGKYLHYANNINIELIEYEDKQMQNPTKKDDLKITFFEGFCINEEYKVYEIVETTLLLINEIERKLKNRIMKETEALALCNGFFCYNLKKSEYDHNNDVYTAYYQLGYKKKK